jgi:hypothetical protein
MFKITLTTPKFKSIERYEPNRTRAIEQAGEKFNSGDYYKVVVLDLEKAKSSGACDVVYYKITD